MKKLASLLTDYRLTDLCPPMLLYTDNRAITASVIETSVCAECMILTVFCI